MSDRALSGSPEEERDPRPAPPNPAAGRSRWLRLVAVAIAVGLVAIGVWRIGVVAGWWGSTPRAYGTLTLVAPHPRETLYALPIFIWQPVPNAATYNLQVVDGNGTVVFAMTTADTTVSVPQSLVLAYGVSYRWWVRAQTRAGVTITSPLIPFELSAP